MKEVSKKARKEADLIARGHGIGKSLEKEFKGGEENFILKIILMRQSALMREMLARLIDLENRLS